jgi:hypothetical protein
MRNNICFTNATIKSGRYDTNDMFFGELLGRKFGCNDEIIFAMTSAACFHLNIYFP